VTVVLFDLDGTLTDPKEGITRSVQHALRAMGRDADDLDALTPYIGPPLRESFRAIEGLTEAEAESAVSAYRDYFGAHGLFENIPYDGVREVLAGLAAEGRRLAVATSKPTVFADRILEHFDLRGWFEVVAGAELDGRRSRKSEVITHALAELGCEAGRTGVMIGDRKHDVVGAHEAGVSSIGVLWGYGGIEELIQAEPDRLAGAVDELPALIAEVVRS
jgi:phosphoglycolate phosphatase